MTKNALGQTESEKMTLSQIVPSKTGRLSQTRTCIFFLLQFWVRFAKGAHTSERTKILVIDLEFLGRFGPFETFATLDRGPAKYRLLFLLIKFFTVFS